MNCWRKTNKRGGYASDLLQRTTKYDCAKREGMRVVRFGHILYVICSFGGGRTDK